MDDQLWRDKCATVGRITTPISSVVHAPSCLVFEKLQQRVIIELHVRVDSYLSSPADATHVANVEKTSLLATMLGGINN